MDDGISPGRELEEREASIRDFYNTGGKCYGASKMLPRSFKTLAPIINSLQWELSNLSDWHLRMAEFGPGGGRWTYTVLDMFRWTGYPLKTEYYLLGSVEEHKLVQRDCLNYFYPECMRTDVAISADALVPYREYLRIRSGQTSHLISEIKFIDLRSRLFRMSPCANKTPGQFARIDVIIAFDAMCLLPYDMLRSAISSIRHVCTHRTGMVYTNCLKHREVEFVRSFNANGFRQVIDPIELSGHVYFVFRAR